MYLSKSSEDYLEAIYQIYIRGEKIKSVEIAKMLIVSKPGVYKANQSSGTSVSVSVKNAGFEFDDDTKSASVTFKEGTTCPNVTINHIASISNGISPTIIKDFTVTSCNGNNVKGTFTYLTKKYQFNSQLN